MSPTDTSYTEVLTIKEIILSFKDYLGYLRSKSWIILLAIILGGLCGLLYASSKQLQYKAELTFVLEEEKSGNALGLGSLAGQIGLDVGGSNGAFSGDNLLSLMRSRSQVKRTLLRTPDNSKKNLAEIYLDINKNEKWVKAIMKKRISLHNSIFDSLSIIQNNTLDQIYSDLLTEHLFIDKLDKKTSIMLIKVLSPDEKFSKIFTEALADQVSDFYVKTKTKKSAENVRILQKQVDSVRAQLNSSISAVASSVDINPNANPSRQILKVPSQRKTVDIEANKAILSELVKNLELSKITLRKEAPLIQVIDSPSYPLPIENFSKVKGVIIGSIFLTFLTTIFLVFKRLLKGVMD